MANVSPGIRNEPRANVWIVVPSFNEAAVIATTLDGIRAWMPNIVVIDDGSSDNTGDDAARSGAHVVRHPINLGQGAAIETGLRYALLQQADYVITFDADGQHRPEDIDVLLATARDRQADVVLGSRFLGSASDIPWGRRWLLKAAAAYTRRTTGLDLTDAHNGFRLFNRKAAEQLRLRQDRMAHASELIDWLNASGLRICEAPVRVIYTEYSMAKGQGILSSINILWDIWSSKLHR